tara:strand:+ start:240 stop:518 length:279 start_codon:yes stop_codon:yes gene_type:complete
MSRLRPKLPARLQGKKFEVGESEVDDEPQMQFGDEVLRMAAIAAVMSMLDAGGPDPSQAGRQGGPVWAQDHRRLASGRSSVLRMRQGRTAWR